MKEQINALLRKVGFKAVEIKLEQLTIDEGAATLEAEVFEAGQPVFIVNEDERIPLPVGEYELDNGFKLVVEEEGVIASYEEMTAEEPEEEEEPEMKEEEKEEVAMTEKPASTPVAKKVVEAVTKETYFSKELHDALVAEITELKSQLAKKEEVEEVELSKPIQHNPESGKTPELHRYGKQGQNPLDNIFAKLNS
jgi:hypothetical protein